MKNILIALAAVGLLSTSHAIAAVGCDRNAVFQTCNGAANNGRKADVRQTQTNPGSGGTGGQTGGGNGGGNGGHGHGHGNGNGGGNPDDNGQGKDHGNHNGDGHSNEDKGGNR